MDTKQSEGRVKQNRAHLVPQVGLMIALNPDFVNREPDSHGNPGTPICRIRYSERQGEWRMASKEEGGLIIFLEEMPVDAHTHIKIVRIARTGKGCHAELVTDRSVQ